MAFNNRVRDDKIDVNFNMAWLWFLQLSDLLREKYGAIISRDPQRYYSVLEAMYSHCVMKIEEKERPGIETELKSIGSRCFPSGKISDRNQYFNSLSAFEACKKLDRDLMGKLDSKKLFFPDMKFHLGLDEVRGRFNLIEKHKKKDKTAF
jgi:hypothetical protein